MENQRTIAIIHKDAELASLLTRIIQLDPNISYILPTLIVDGRTQPQNVADFVGDHNPDLVLLVENFSSVRRGDGIVALSKVRQYHPDMLVYMISGGRLHHEEAMQNGATGYFPMVSGRDEIEEFLSGTF